VDPVITGTYPVRSAVEAFGIAGDRQRACKVLLDFT
jgi:hypothetical protein